LATIYDDVPIEEVLSRLRKFYPTYHTIDGELRMCLAIETDLETDPRLSTESGLNCEDWLLEVASRYGPAALYSKRFRDGMMERAGWRDSWLSPQ
jgi:hypothetical protein